jgi:hypothetical protein
MAGQRQAAGNRILISRWSDVEGRFEIRHAHASSDQQTNRQFAACFIAIEASAARVTSQGGAWISQHLG